VGCCRPDRSDRSHGPVWPQQLGINTPTSSWLGESLESFCILFVFPFPCPCFDYYHFDYYRHRDRNEGGSNKERWHHKHRSRDRGGRFDKESLKKCFQYKAKKREKAFLAQLSDLDKSSDTYRSSSPTSDDDDKKKKKRDKETTGFIGLCLAAGRHKGFCTMAGEADGARTPILLLDPRVIQK
jgi:hypothetical protein